MSQREYDDSNSGVLFKNHEKTPDNPKWPDYKGSLNVNGVDHWLSAWLKEAGPNSKTPGQKFFSITIKPKTASEHRGGAKNTPAQKAAQPDFSDDISF